MSEKPKRNEVCPRCGQRIEEGESTCPPDALDRIHDKCPKKKAPMSPVDDNEDTVKALETALRLAKTGQIRGAVLLIAYHDDRHAFRMCDLREVDVPPFCLLMGALADNLRGQWMDRAVEGADELPTSLGTAPEDD